MGFSLLFHLPSNTSTLLGSQVGPVTSTKAQLHYSFWLLHSSVTTSTTEQLTWPGQAGRPGSLSLTGHGTEPGGRHGMTVPTGANLFSLANSNKQTAPACVRGAARGKACIQAQSWLPASQQHSQEQKHSLQNPTWLLPSLCCLWEPTSRLAANYTAAFKYTLRIIQVPGQKPPAFTRGENDSSSPRGLLPSSFLCFRFLVFLSLLRRRSGCLNIIKANYFSLNTCLQAQPRCTGDKSILVPEPSPQPHALCRVSGRIRPEVTTVML